MLFMLLSSFFILSGAIKTTSLQPLVKMEVHNTSAPDLMSVLASKGNPDVLLKILENADPTKVGAIILLIQNLLADTELDLETLTTAVTDANNVYDSAESAHSASVEAQTVGVAKLAQDVVDVVLAQTEGVAKLAQDVSDSEQAKVDGEAALAFDVASALGEKQTALGVKIAAQRALDAEESRLVSEIDRLKQLIVDIESLATTACSWSVHSNVYSLGYADSVSTGMTLSEAKLKCLPLSGCNAVTCKKDGVCTVRASSTLRTSPTAEVSYVPSLDCYPPCSWSKQSNVYSRGYANSVSTKMTLSEAKRKCRALSECKAVTCKGDVCTVRASSTLTSSPTAEISYVPEPDCELLDETSFLERSVIEQSVTAASVNTSGLDKQNVGCWGCCTRCTPGVNCRTCCNGWKWQWRWLKFEFKHQAHCK